MDASTASIIPWLCVGHHSTTRHRGTTLVSANELLLLPPNGFALYSCIYHRFVAINGVGVYLYAIVYQAQDEEDYGGAWDVMKEGMLSSSAFFVVSASDLV